MFLKGLRLPVAWDIQSVWKLLRYLAQDRIVVGSQGEVRYQCQDL